MTPEGKVKAAVDRILKKHNIWYFKPVSRGMGSHGISDYICCLHGRFIALECKGTDKGKPTALQVMQMDRIRQSGGIAVLVTPSTIEDFECKIMEMMRET